jgi:hypothetical protein
MDTKTLAQSAIGPIPDFAPSLLTVPRRVVVRPGPGQSYRLLFGHPRASSPGYDLSQWTDAKMLERAGPATLGTEDRNAAWVDPSPWTERYASVLWAVVIDRSLPRKSP